MNILIADKLSDNAMKKLSELGGVVTFNPTLTADELHKYVNECEILIVRSTKVTAQTINAAPMLSLIIRAGAGVNNIDLTAAGQRAIHVANCPGKNSDAVAELTIGLLIAADRQIVNASADLRAGRWRKNFMGRLGVSKDALWGLLVSELSVKQLLLEPKDCR